MNSSVQSRNNTEPRQRKITLEPRDIVLNSEDDDIPTTAGLYTYFMIQLSIS